MKYYGRKAMVLYPPVGDLIKSKTKLTKKSYYVCLSRLVKQKGIALAVKVCSKYKLPLYVVGYGDEYNNLWKFVTERHTPYLDYQKMTTCTIPIMIFEQNP